MTQAQTYAIVGFDLRRGPLLDFGGPKRLGDHWPSDIPAPAPFPATISEQRWPRSAKCDALDIPVTNGVNLFFLPDLHRVDPDGISVAFALRAEDAEVFRSSSWILPIDERHLHEELGWRLLGYDVADSCLGYSSFYGFTWKPGELTTILGEGEVTFNRHGLLDDEHAAETVANIFSNYVSTCSHAPFYPVRVWAQETPTGG